MRKNIFNQSYRRFFTILLIMAISSILFISCAESKGKDTLPLSSPKSFNLTGGDRVLTVLWGRLAPAQNIDPTYEVWYSEQNDINTATLWAENLSPEGNLGNSVITGLENGKTYYVWLRAVYGELGKASFTSSVAGMPVPIPAVPSNVDITVGETLLEVRWDKVDYAFTYDISYSTENVDLPPNNATVKTVSNSAVVLSGLTNDTTYYIWIKASNTAGNSDNSAKFTASPKVASTMPLAPTALSVQASNKRLTVAFDSVPSAVTYDIYISQDNNSSVANIVNTVAHNIPKVSAGITGLTNDLRYYIWVKAKNSVGESAFSPVTNAIPIANNIPINFTDYNFVLGDAVSDYIFAEKLPLSAFIDSDRLWDRLTRVKETALGNLFTDSVKWYIDERSDEDIDFVFLNGGFINNAITQGQITVNSMILSTDPDGRDYKIVYLTLIGTDVIQLFDDVANVAHNGRGGGCAGAETGFFGVVSKEVRYTISYPILPSGIPNKTLDTCGKNPPGVDYSRGVIKADTLRLNGLPIDPNKEYRIATTDELATGKYYTILKTNGRNVTYTNILFWHAVAEYIYDQGKITPYLDGRIVIEGGIPLGPSRYEP